MDAKTGRANWEYVSWYMDGTIHVAVLTGQPQDMVQIGTGDTQEEAYDNLQNTPIQSTGRDSGEASAIAWAQGAGWISMPEIEWEDLHAADYVRCCYGAEGDEPGDCYTRVGQDQYGMWWVDDGDDTDRTDRTGPWWSRERAVQRAESIASESHEGEDGEDASAMIARLDREAAGRTSAGGEWAVAWDEPGCEREIGDRYESREDAERVIAAWYAALYEHTPTALAHLMRHPVLVSAETGE